MGGWGREGGVGIYFASLSFHSSRRWSSRPNDTRLKDTNKSRRAIAAASLSRFSLLSLESDPREMYTPCRWSLGNVKFQLQLAQKPLPATSIFAPSQEAPRLCWITVSHQKTPLEVRGRGETGGEDVTWSGCSVSSQSSCVPGTLFFNRPISCLSRGGEEGIFPDHTD